MNFATAVTQAIKLLRRQGQSVTQDHLLFVLFSATNQSLTVAAFKPGEEAVAVRVPFEVHNTACGTFPASFKDLLIKLQDMPHDWSTDLDDRGDFLSMKGASFQYRFDLKSIMPNWSKTFDLPLDTSIVYDDIIETTKQQPEPIMITVTNNYFQDLSSAIEAGIITKKGAKNPTKADLYSAIEAHNATFTKTDVYGDLLNQWKAKKSAAKVKKASKLDVLVAAIREGVTDVDVLVDRTGMKPGGVKAWMGVIKNQGVENWKKSLAKAA
jgi:hypothetical protein